MRPRAPRLLSLALASLLVLVPFAAQADQKDPRLDRLFGELHTTDDIDTANSLVRDIWAVWTENADPQVSDLMTDGMNAMQVGDWRRALIAFDEVVMLAPAFAEGWNKRATVYYYAGRLDESLADVERVLDLEPRHFGALSGRGLIYLDQGSLPEALNAFEHALDTNPHMPNIERQAAAIREAIKDSAI